MAGTRAEIAVPTPDSDSTASVPATRLTRCRLAVSPNPAPAPAVLVQANLNVSSHIASGASVETRGDEYRALAIAPADPGGPGVRHEAGDLTQPHGSALGVTIGISAIWSTRARACGSSMTWMSQPLEPFGRTAVAQSPWGNSWSGCGCGWERTSIPGQIVLA
jgi:hypothetical protein